MTRKFGSSLRAYRLGYHWSEKHQSFIRTSALSLEAILIELCPADGVPVVKTPCREHICWWDSPEILDMVPALREIKGVAKHTTFVVDNDGNEIEWKG